MKKCISQRLYRLIIIFLFSSSLFSCTKDLEPLSPAAAIADPLASRLSAKDEGDIPYQEGDIILGEMKKNPYALKNMQAAYKSVDARGIKSLYPFAVRTTHYYVKFKPSTPEQYEALSRDTTISLSDFPIEATIVQNGNRYHDKSLPDSVPTYQYTAVPVNYQFSDTIPYQILESLYIPEVDPAALGKDSTNDAYIDSLLDQAYVQTGNFEDTVKTSLTARRYRPGGRIQLFDTRMGGLIGMEGVRVQARRWFTYHEGYPDFNGYYSVNGQFRRPCNYSIWFARGDFSIREHLFGLTCWINGPKRSGNWDYNITGGYDRFTGHIFRGAFRYHYKDIGGLKRPWAVHGLYRQLYIGKNSQQNWAGLNNSFLNFIKIARYGDKNVEYLSDETFTTTVHETAHTSHKNRMNGGVIQFWQVSSEIVESWAVGVSWFISNIEYAGRGIANYALSNYSPPNPPRRPCRQAYQYWNLSVDGEYTSLFINLFDNVNDVNLLPGTPNDQVTGYTLAGIENTFLKHVYGVSSLNTQLKANKPAGVTDGQIDLLLSSY